MKKKENKKMHTPRHKFIHNPIPTSNTLHANVFECALFLIKKCANMKQWGYEYMNVSWCTHLLVLFLFHDVK